MAAQHLSMPFGATSAVHAWDRVAKLILKVARVLLCIPVIAYVDDFLSAEWEESCGHAKECFARLVRCLLGPSAVAPHKLEHGAVLDVLGLVVTADSAGIWCKPATELIAKWCAVITHALESGKLCPGSAAKLAGGLSWASQHSFHRLGRAMLIPLYAQKKRRSPKVLKSLELALKWWLEVLQGDLQQCWTWSQIPKEWIHVCADARSTPPRIAAVIIVDGCTFYCDCEPPAEAMAHFRERRDGQIMGLELLALALALSSFKQMIAGRRIVLWSDNVGAEKVLAMAACGVHAYGCHVIRQRLRDQLRPGTTPASRIASGLHWRS